MTTPRPTAREARERLYETIRSDAPFEEKAREALELGREYLDADNGHLARIDRQTDHWEAVVTTDPPGGEIPPGLELDLGTTYCRRTIEAESQVTLYDAPAQGWADDPAFEAHGYHCYHGTTIVLDGDPYGTVCFVAEDPRREEFRDDETMFAELIAQLLERELERERHEAELRRQTNLTTVLNRVLRHNLRNDMSVVRGYTQLMGDELDDDTYSTVTLDSIDGLLALSEKARQLDQIVTGEFDRSSRDVRSLVERVADSVAAEYPSASITVTGEEVSAPLLPSFDRAVEELVENAAKHAGDEPVVDVTVGAVPNAIEVRIADDGPGLSTQEATVLESGSETPLVHGSGLGLWLAYWIVTSHDGTVDATTTDEGTSMTITVPRVESTGLDRDLTELTEARDRYRAAFDGAHDAMVVVDDDARIVDANAAAADVFGLDAQALLGRQVGEYLAGVDDPGSEWFEFGEGGVERDTTTVVRPDDVVRHLEYSVKPDVVPGNHLVVYRDVTERVERETELERKTRAMEEAPVGITITDPDRTDNPIVYANEQFRELTGYERAEIVGRNCRFLQGEGTDPSTVREVREAIDRREPVEVVLRNYRADGSAFWNRLTVAPVEDSDGTLTNFVGFQEDVTDRVEAGAILPTASRE